MARSRSRRRGSGFLDRKVSMGYIGVDLDGTLAEYHGWGDDSIGAPVPKMLARVKKWLAEGQEVRIVTARVSGAYARSQDRKSVV